MRRRHPDARGSGSARSCASRRSSVLERLARCSAGRARRGSTRPWPSCASGATSSTCPTATRPGSPGASGAPCRRLRRRRPRCRSRPPLEAAVQRQRQGAGVRRPPCPRLLPQQTVRVGPARRHDPPGVLPRRAAPRPRAPQMTPAVRPAVEAMLEEVVARASTRCTPKARGRSPSCSTWSSSATSCRLAPRVAGRRRPRPHPDPRGAQGTPRPAVSTRRVAGQAVHVRVALLRPSPPP